MKVHNVHLAGLGSWLPAPTSMADVVAAGLFDGLAAEESGQTAVHLAGDTPPPQMAVAAARQALQRAGVEGAEIDLLLHASVFFQGPEMWYPQGYILREVGARNVPAVELRQGCNGMMSALEYAVGQFAANPACRTALLTTADNFESPLFRRWRSGLIGLFPSDGASAVVLSAERGFATLDSVNSALCPDMEAMTRGNSPLFPPVATSGLEIDFYDRMAEFGESVVSVPEAFKKLAQLLVELTAASLDEAGIRLRDVRRVIYANVARWLAERNLAEPLGIPLSRTAWEYSRRIGHVGASDQVLSLDHLLSIGELEAGDRVLLVGEGPGWSLATAVLTITDRPSWLDAPVH